MTAELLRTIFNREPDLSVKGRVGRNGVKSLKKLKKELEKDQRNISVVIGEERGMLTLKWSNSKETFFGVALCPVSPGKIVVKHTRSSFKSGQEEPEWSVTELGVFGPKYGRLKTSDGKEIEKHLEYARGWAKQIPVINEGLAKIA